ncbi:hypothetical protein QQY24_32615 [Streptomyces sp. TG1A-8]|uniref:hypothetical protein n=1 Tax=Streptomyces sp. TG1A-8 TaxID=3051385 RepID=UPI00265C7388|nr:hypothetical protein [Streptomyces sp. TG1A-8]MDO0929856.1 hypothetical protein [Streptomyces sp. TG1A-8]
MAERAPEEQDTAADLLNRDPDEITRMLSSRSGDSELGFGLGEVAVLVTPLVWMVLQQFAQELAGVTVRAATGRLSTAWRRLRGRPPESVSALPRLDEAQREELRGIVRQRAQEAGLAEDTAGQLALSVIRHIERNQ